MYVQGTAPLDTQEKSGLRPTSTSSVQDAINANLASDKKYMESPFSVSMLPDQSYVLWINRQITHALPVAIAWLANNDKMQPFAFTVSSFPLPSPYQPPPRPIAETTYFTPLILHMFITFLVAVSLVTVPCLAVRAVVSDRAVQTKHVLAGLSQFKILLAVLQFCL
jgi:hypothetical protein